jgi:ATP/ADP translocase
MKKRVLIIWIVNVILTIVSFGFVILIQLFYRAHLIWLNHSGATLIDFVYPYQVQPIGMLILFLTNRSNKNSGKKGVFNSSLILFFLIFQSIPIILFCFIGISPFLLYLIRDISSGTSNFVFEIIRSIINLIFLISTSATYISYRKSIKKH